MASAANRPELRSDRLQDFDRLYAAHAVALHDYLLGRTADVETARDLLQEVYLRLWRRIAEVRDLSPERERAWLFTVARNLVVDFYRSRASADAAHATLRQNVLNTGAEIVAAADVATLDREAVENIDAALGRLPETLRVALVLQVLGDRTSSEIGELLGRPAGTVRYQIAQARRLLASELSLTRSEEGQASR